MRPHWISAAILMAFFTGGCTTWLNTRAKPFDFALIGDVPYTPEQVTNSFPNMIRELNAANLEFVVHDGDIKSGGDPCTDELFTARLKQLETIRHPLILVLGDNEWTDCKATNGMGPEEALAKLREMFARARTF